MDGEPPGSNLNDRAEQGIAAVAKSMLQTTVTTPVRVSCQGQQHSGTVSWDGTSCAIRDATGATLLDFHPDELVTYSARLASITLETTRGSCTLRFGSVLTRMAEYFSVGGRYSNQTMEQVQQTYGTGAGTWAGLLGWMWVSTGRTPPQGGNSYNPFTVISPGRKAGSPINSFLGCMLIFVVFFIAISVLLSFVH